MASNFKYRRPRASDATRDPVIATVIRIGRDRAPDVTKQRDHDQYLVVY